MSRNEVAEEVLSSLVAQLRLTTATLRDTSIQAITAQRELDAAEEEVAQTQSYLEEAIRNLDSCEKLLNERLEKIENESTEE